MRRLFSAITIAMALATGCSSDITGPNGSIVGTYSLRTVNGSPLPYQVSYNRAIRSEEVRLNSDGSYTDYAYYTDGSSFTENGYWTQYNNQITFDDQTDHLQYQGSISGSVLTESTPGSNGSPGYIAVYQKN